MKLEWESEEKQMQKTSEIRIMTYAENGREYFRAIIYDTKSRTWKELGAGLDADVNLMIMCAKEVREKFERGVTVAKKQSR